MKRLFLDCQMGIAGDMLTATLLGLVDNPKIWIERLNQIGIPNVTYTLIPPVTIAILESVFFVGISPT